MPARLLETWRCAHPGRRAARVLLGAALVVLQPPALAQEPADARDGAFVAPAVVVTGSRLPEARSALPPGAAVIDRAAVERQAPASAAQLLQGVGGAYVDQAGGPAGFASLYLRGADPSSTVVFIDGVRANDPTNSRGGAFDFGSLDPATIERVEILPGAASAVYGADAMAGVVNIVTRAPDGTAPGLRAGGGVGGSGFRSALVAGNAGTSSLAVNAGAALNEDGPWRSGSESRLGTLWARGRLAPGPGLALDGTLRLTRREGTMFPEDSGGTVYAVRRELERRSSDGAFASLGARKDLAWGEARLYATGSRATEQVDSPGVAPGVRDPFGIPPNRADSRYDRYALGASGATAADGSSAVLGAEFQRESGEADSALRLGPQWVPGSFALTRTTWSVFGEGSVRPTASTSLQAGARADWVSGLGLNPSFRVTGSLAIPRTSASLRASFGTGFKPPSFFALGNPIVGNRDLMPEKSRTAEVGVDASAARAPLAAAATMFRTVYKNLIDFDAGPPPRLVNRPEVGISGAELSLRYGADDLSVGGSAALLDFDLPPGQVALRNRPRAQARLFGSVALMPSLVLAANLAWTGKVYDSSVPTGPVYLPAAAVLNLALTFRTPTAAFRVAVDNALDQSYEQFVGVPGLGRRVRAEVELKI